MLVDSKNIDLVLSHLKHQTILSIDTETYGVRIEDNAFSIQISSGEGDFYFNLHDYGDDTPVLNYYDLSKLREVFEDADKSWFIYNAKFDMHKLKNYGFEIKGDIYCNIVLERLIRNNLLSYKMSNVAPMYGFKKDDAVDNYISKNKCYTWTTRKGKKSRTKNKHYDQVPFNLMYEYGLRDSNTTYKLGNAQLYVLKHRSHNDNLTHKLLKNEVKLTKTCFAMERLGMRVDPDYIKKALAYSKNNLDTYLSEYKNLTGVDFKDSAKSFVPIFDKFGLKYPLTEKGNPSFNKKALERMERNSLTEKILKIRNYDKFIGTYYESFLHFATEEEDGHILRATINQAGTETGRFSYSSPNFQNVPKEDEGKRDYYVRGCFIPREDYYYFMLDYSAMEYRLLLDYAGETSLIKEVLGGKDLHQATGDLLNTTRKKAKTINFMTLYGGGTLKLANALGVNEQVARRIRKDYFSKLPKVKTLIDAVTSKGKNQGYVRNFYGRRCHIRSREEAYILINHIIQGTAADIVKHSMNDCHDYLSNSRSRMLLNVHDEIVFEIHKNETDIVKDLKQLMEKPYSPQNGLPMKVDVEWSDKSWAFPDKKEWEC